MKKKLFTLLVALCMVACLAVCTLASAKAATLECKTSADVNALVMDGYNRDKQGPIQIIQGKYTSNAGNTFDVYVVMVCGTENEVVYASNAGLSLDIAAVNVSNSPYYIRIKSVIQKNIPEGSRIILVGHSLGGMMTQQLACDKDLQKEYIIKYDLCFGSPLTNPNDYHEGGLKRLGDTFDVIPYETANVVLAPKETITYTRENGGYYINVYDAHMSSYKDNDTWGEYDVTGKKGGKATLTLDLSTREFYKSDYTLVLQDVLDMLN